MTNKNKTFGSFHNGFTITFDNGLLLSTRFGPMNYCENKSGVMGKAAGDPTKFAPLLSDDVEVAVWVADDETDMDRAWVTEWQTEVFAEGCPAQDVRGYVKIDDWLRLLDWCRNWVRV